MRDRPPPGPVQVAVLVFAALVAVIVLVALVAAGRSDGKPAPPDERPPTEDVPAPILVGAPAHDLKVAALEAKLEREHRRLLQARHRVHQLVRTLQHRSSTREAIGLACLVYGDCATLWRKAMCESGGYAYAHNSSGASGLFQFLPSTWASTPFGAFSIWSPYANALAAGWMHEHGRGGEWVCR